MMIGRTLRAYRETPHAEIRKFLSRLNLDAMLPSPFQEFHHASAHTLPVAKNQPTTKPLRRGRGDFRKITVRPRPTCQNNGLGRKNARVRVLDRHACRTFKSRLRKQVQPFLSWHQGMGRSQILIGKLPPTVRQSHDEISETLRSCGLEEDKPPPWCKETLHMT